MGKVQTKRTKQGQQRHVTGKLKGWTNLFESEQVLKIDKGTASATETLQIVESFLHENNSKELIILTTDYLQAHRRSLKSYYSKMGSMFKNFALPLASFYYSVLSERIESLKLNKADFFFSPASWLTFTAGKQIQLTQGI